MVSSTGNVPENESQLWLLDEKKAIDNVELDETFASAVVVALSGDAV
jgi:hypothetical protein